MSGEFKGVAARIRAEVPRAVYIHCSAHRLNLALQDALEDLRAPSKTMAVVNSLHVFFDGSTKRKAMLINKQLTNHNETTTTKRLDTTRWGSRRASVKAIIKLLVPIMHC
jgi:hypothetical protein